MVVIIENKARSKVSISLQEPYKSKFLKGIREVIFDAGNKITIYDKIVLYLARKH